MSSISLPIDEDFAQDDDDTRTVSSGRTMATTTTMFRHEHGRTYHAYRDGEYWAPNDAQQNNHEGIVHHICIQLLQDKLYLAPIRNPEHIIDLGTGTALWAIDMAIMFPDAEVIGTDLTPTNPPMPPDNLRLEVDDAASLWTWPENYFDFLHIRGLFGSIADWPRLYQQAMTHMRPGGYIEQIEWSVHMQSIEGVPEDSALGRYGQYFVQAGQKTGKTFETAERMAGMIRDAGFVDIVEHRYKMPVGPWCLDPKLKELGRWNELNWQNGMEGWLLATFTRVFGWTYEKVQDYMKELTAALRDRKHHVWHEARLVYARKPV